MPNFIKWAVKPKNVSKQDGVFVYTVHGTGAKHLTVKIECGPGSVWPKKIISTPDWYDSAVATVCRVFAKDYCKDFQKELDNIRKFRGKNDHVKGKTSWNIFQESEQLPFQF